MPIKIRNTLTKRRIAIVGAMVFAEAFLTPLNLVLSQGIWPSPVQLAHNLTTAILQVITLSVGLLEKT